MPRRLVLLALLSPLAAAAQQEATLPPLLVTAPEAPAATAASEHHVAREELAARPVARVGEVLEATPGLIATQHSGEGKANQFFLRGFNLDHGTDLAISLDGMPLNMRTHAHGQGYADLNFLLPELLEGLTARKGPFAADLGDFATAGALRLGLVNRLDRPFAQVTAGSFGYWRGLAAGSWDIGTGTLLAAGEVAGYDGPWQRPDRLRRLNGLLRWSEGTAEDGFTLTGMAYAGRWNATDQVPARAIASGLIGRYGTLDPSDGGRAQRYSLSASWARSSETGTTRLNAYAIRSTLDLFSNFTYLLDDEANGDQFLQRDRRWVLGLDASHAERGEVAGMPLEARFGLQTRQDEIRLGLFRTSNRSLLSSVREDTASQGSAGLWADGTLRWTPWLRTMLGLRGDWAGGRVRSDLAANSGRTDALIASPKAGLVLGPFAGTELFLNAGTGFHSNDLRGATIGLDPNDRLTPLARVPLLVRAKGAEIGLRTRPVEGLESSLALFVLALGSEIVFVGDAGTTQAGRPSRRIGVEWTNHWRPLPWLGLDLDVAITRARFTDNAPEGRHIPGAPSLVTAAGVTLEHPDGWFGATRLRWFGARPLVEDDSVRARPSVVVNGRAGYRFANGAALWLDGFNLFGSRASQIEYFYTSRLPGEPAGGVADRHLHPMERTALRLTLSVPL